MAKAASIAQKLIPWRIWVQVSFLLVWLDPLAIRFHAICGAVFHCHSCPLATFACPIGVLGQFSSLHLFPFVAVGLLIIVGGLLGGFVCGWACPFGFLQDIAAKVPTAKWNPPRWMSYFRYVVLIGLVFVIPYFFGLGHPLFFCRVCPAGGLEASLPRAMTAALSGEQANWPNAVKISVVVVIVVAMFFIYRPWCVLFCPLGAIFGLFNRVSALFLRFHPAACTSCNLCRTNCAIGILPDKQASDPRCIRCLECSQCPPQALTVGSVFERTKAVGRKNNDQTDTEITMVKCDHKAKCCSQRRPHSGQL